MTDITELAQSLKATAEKATSGQWERGDGKHGGELLVYCDDALGSAVCEATSEYNAIPKYQRINNLDFIALANPANVLALVEALEKAQRANAAQDDHINQQQDRIDILEKRNAELGREVTHLQSLKTVNAARQEAQSEFHRGYSCGHKDASLESRTVTAENLQESAYRAGLTSGWNLGLANNNDGFNKCLAAHAAGIKWEAE